MLTTHVVGAGEAWEMAGAIVAAMAVARNAEDVTRMSRFMVGK
jgi:hypothetical protein